MNIIKYLTLLLIFCSSLIGASETEITAEKLVISKDKTNFTYLGDVKINFQKSEMPEFTSDSVYIEKSSTTFEGNVVLSSNEGKYFADKMVLTETNHGYVATTNELEFKPN